MNIHQHPIAALYADQLVTTRSFVEYRFPCDGRHSDGRALWGGRCPGTVEHTTGRIVDWHASDDGEVLLHINGEYRWANDADEVDLDDMYFAEDGPTRHVHFRCLWPTAEQRDDLMRILLETPVARPAAN